MKRKWFFSGLKSFLEKSKTESHNFFTDFGEFLKILQWYLSKKARFLLVGFEETKGIIVDLLLARRGAYQHHFLRTGLISLTIVSAILGPMMVSSYPRATGANSFDVNAQGTVLGTYSDLGSMDLGTQESEKPRRDVTNYVVKEGDTLSGIAKQFGVDTDSIKALNKNDDVNLLHPGDTIKIPPVTGVIVTVASGDTIYSLAKKYSLPSAQSIVDWPYNTFVDDTTFALAAGQTLVIPGGVQPEDAPVAQVLRKTNDAQTPFVGGTGIFIWPTNGVITQYFSNYHNGLDIASNSVPAITAADSGRVVSVLYDNHDYGYHVIIDHGNGYRTLYGHMSRIDVSVGDNVSRGQRIGLMGSTGRSTGPHLHFVVYSGGRAVNPLGLLK